MKSIKSLLFLSFFAFSATASAAVVSFTDQTSFNAAVGATDYFEDFSAYDGIGQANLSETPLVIGDLSLTEMGGKSVTSFVGVNDGNTPMDGGRVRMLQTARSDIPVNNEVVFSFATPMIAFGFDVMPNPNRVGQAVNLMTDTGESFQFVFPMTHVIEFRGFLFEAAFSSITFSVDFANDVAYGIDNLRGKTADVPEPGTLSLLGLGLLGLAGARRKRT